MEEIVDPNIMQYLFAIIRIFKMLSMQVTSKTIAFVNVQC